MSAKVWVFFYGSYINRSVLAEADLRPDRVEVASVAGFALRIGPRANMVPQPFGAVHGILATASHAELHRLYTEHAKGKLGETYLPEAILAVDAAGRPQPALTYLCHDMAAGPADPAYVERIAGPAEAYGFPDDYVATIRRFAAGGG